MSQDKGIGAPPPHSRGGKPPPELLLPIDPELLLLLLDAELELLVDTEESEPLELLELLDPAPPEPDLGSCSSMSAMMWQPNATTKDDADRRTIAAFAVDSRDMSARAYRQTRRVDKD